MTTEASPLAAVQLMRLVSPALPIGAYAGSEGLEYAVELGWVHDGASAREWIGGRLEHGLVGLDLPLLKRFYTAWQDDRADEFARWSEFLRASRESTELWAQERSLGRSLARLLSDLDVEPARDFVTHPLASYIGLFALAARHWQIALNDAAHGYAFAWCENQMAAAIKLVPLGQTEGQSQLGQLIERIPTCVARGLALEDDELGASEPGLAIASSLHETQHTRLFRS